MWSARGERAARCRARRRARRASGGTSSARCCTRCRSRRARAKRRARPRPGPASLDTCRSHARPPFYQHVSKPCQASCSPTRALPPHLRVLGCCCPGARAPGPAGPGREAYLNCAATQARVPRRPGAAAPPARATTPHPATLTPPRRARGAGHGLLRPRRDRAARAARDVGARLLEPLGARAVLPAAAHAPGGRRRRRLPPRLGAGARRPYRGVFLYLAASGVGFRRASVQAHSLQRGFFKLAAVRLGRVFSGRRSCDAGARAHAPWPRAGSAAVGQCTQVPGGRRVLNTNTPVRQPCSAGSQKGP